MKLHYIYIGNVLNALSAITTSGIIYWDDRDKSKSGENHNVLQTVNGRYLSVRRSLGTVTAMDISQIQSAIITGQSSGISVLHATTEITSSICGRDIGANFDPIGAALTLVPLSKLKGPNGDECELEDLVFVDIDTRVFLPLSYPKSSTGRVLDNYHNGATRTVGFTTALGNDWKDLIIEGVAIESSKYVHIQPILDMPERQADGADMTAVTNKYIKEIPRLSKINTTRWKNMNKHHTIHPIMAIPNMTPPSSIVLCTRALGDAASLVGSAIDECVMLKTYGHRAHCSSIPELSLDAVKKWREETKLYHDAVNIIQIPEAPDSDLTDYTNFLRVLFGVITSNPKYNHLRTITILEDDKVPLQRDFRKEYKIRYVNRILETGKCSSFITNKY